MSCRSESPGPSFKIFLPFPINFIIIPVRQQAGSWAIQGCVNKARLLKLLWWVHGAVKAAWRRQALWIFMYLTGHSSIARGGRGAPARSSGLPRGQSDLTEKSTQPHANLAHHPYFSVTVDPSMLRSDIFIDFLKFIQLVSMLFITEIIILPLKMSLSYHVCVSGQWPHIG